MIAEALLSVHAVIVLGPVVLAIAIGAIICAIVPPKDREEQS